eukprot:m.320386 g.320386  ORF g.320386 m.320386 type:complete len:108 (-) comp20318_c0_seq1:99-422(-)
MTSPQVLYFENSELHQTHFQSQVLPHQRQQAHPDLRLPQKTVLLAATRKIRAANIEHENLSWCTSVLVVLNPFKLNAEALYKVPEDVSKVSDTKYGCKIASWDPRRY